MSAEVTPSIQPGILLATLASPQSVCSLASVSARERNISSPSYQSASIAVLTRASVARSEEDTSELQSLIRNSYAVVCLNKKKALTEREKKRRQVVVSHSKQ